MISNSLNLPLRRIILGTLAAFLALASVFMLLVYYRVSRLSQADFSVCTGLADMQMVACMQNISLAFITNPQWTAALFSVLILIALILGYLSAPKTPGLSIAITLLIGILTGVLLLVTVEPGRIPAIAAILGIPLGGLMVHSRTRRKTGN